MNICINCLQDPLLKKRVEDLNILGECSVCRDGIRLCIDLVSLCDYIDSAFRNSFKKIDLFPFDYESPDNEYNPIQVLEELTKLDSSTCIQILDILIKMYNKIDNVSGVEEFYNYDWKYELINISGLEHQYEWEYFKNIIKHKYRFYSQNMSDIINQLFDNINDLDSRSDIKLIKKLRPQKNKYLYRARRANTNDLRKIILDNPKNELGYPPEELAPEGRMSPRGIPVFYGAFEKNTCLEELKLFVGEIVIIGKFEIVDPLKILDLSAFEKANILTSYFDPDYDRKISRIEFLRKFQDEISKPVLPNDENIDYLPTQALAEFIFYHLDNEIDGIQFKSSQCAGNNIVLKKESAILEIKEKLYKKRSSIKIPNRKLFFDIDKEVKVQKIRLIESDIEMKKCISKNSELIKYSE